MSLEPAALSSYFALMESAALLSHAVENQLRREGGLSYVQFQLLARLADAPDHRLTMTALADGVVYSRSGLTHQAGLLEKANLVTRGPSPDDRRATLVTLTDSGLATVAAVMPGHVQVTQDLLVEPLDHSDLEHLAAILGRVRDHMRSRPPRSAAPRRRRTPGQAAGMRPAPSADSEQLGADE